MRLKPDDLALPKPEKISIASFKAGDKKHLLENFFSDERV